MICNLIVHVSVKLANLPPKKPAKYFLPIVLPGWRTRVTSKRKNFIFLSHFSVANFETSIFHNYIFIRSLISQE